MLVGWGRDGKPEIRIALTREFARGMHDSRNRPQHPMNESTAGLPLVLNPVLFILGIALARGAFKHYKIADEIFELQPPQYDDHWILEQADHIKDVPVFQGATCHGPTGKIQKSSSFSKQLTNAAQRAGMENITINDIRRETLVKANGKALVLL
ncbi:uncharacterized protein RAG0_12564 [Rhynchosporium agropyri]|uniref:Uncharacterized protein n=1 Tax=Rhynchosporium agropyri TaxID=914238 RepID=A0A1E1LBD1_9HELO|nr:uncharacterized protein RAG0_12564 [Rhynchosporium agropyri]